MKTFVTLTCILFGAVSFAGMAHADEPIADITASEKQPQNSLNANPMGVVAGAYGLNYERLFGGTHGVLVEGGLATASNAKSSATSYGASVGYRWHWSGKQASGFLGMNVGLFSGSGSATVASGGMDESFDLNVRSMYATANIGKRWAWDSGLNITFRIGGGYGSHSVSTSSTDPDAQRAVSLVQDVLTFLPIAFDGELSIGYMF